MENRIHHRSPSNESIEVWLGNNFIGEFNAANISTQGMYIEGDCSKLKTYDRLTVKFPENPNLSFQPTKCGEIVHKTTDGFGVRWNN